MKKLIVSGILVLTCVFSSAFAVSWGGMLDNNTKLSANNDFSAIYLNQSNGVYLYVNSNLSENGNLRFSGEGLYKYKLNCDFKNSDTTFTNIADVDLLKLSGDWTIKDGHLALALGRFMYSDYTGSVFAQVSDGLYASYDTLKAKASVYAGCTGLLNRLNVEMTENEYDKDDQLYALCPMYIPVLADFTYKALFESHKIGLQLAAYIPVDDDHELKAYGTLIANGYIGTMASYDAKITVGTEKFDGLMLDAALDANVYFRSDIKVTAGAEYISGANGSLKPFKTMSKRSIGTSPFAYGAIIPKVGAMYASGKIYAGVTERIIISMPEDKAEYNGFDTAVNVLYNMFSDVQLGLDAGAYISKESAYTNFYATAKAILAF
jgi:hypothetical protein